MRSNDPWIRASQLNLSKSSSSAWYIPPPVILSPFATVGPPPTSSSSFMNAKPSSPVVPANPFAKQQSTVPPVASPNGLSHPASRRVHADDELSETSQPEEQDVPGAAQGVSSPRSSAPAAAIPAPKPRSGGAVPSTTLPEGRSYAGTQQPVPLYRRSGAPQTSDAQLFNILQGQNLASAARTTPIQTLHSRLEQSLLSHEIPLASAPSRSHGKGKGAAVPKAKTQASSRDRVVTSINIVNRIREDREERRRSQPQGVDQASLTAVLQPLIHAAVAQVPTGQSAPTTAASSNQMPTEPVRTSVTEGPSVEALRQNQTGSPYHSDTLGSAMRQYPAHTSSSSARDGTNVPVPFE